MKVFLSWSGAVSKQIALALREWLPNVVQAIEPWMSSEDIDKGARWSSDVANQLATTKAGIICVTPDNMTASWLNFESGALSKTVEKEMVCPYLFRLKPSELVGPLVQFQASEASEEDTLKMVKTLNRAVTSHPLSETKLAESFTMWWGTLEAKLSSIKFPDHQSKKPERSTEDMLEEILTIVRDQDRLNRSLIADLNDSRVARAAERFQLESFRAEAAKASVILQEDFKRHLRESLAKQEPTNLQLLYELLSKPSEQDSGDTGKK